MLYVTAVTMRLILAGVLLWAGISKLTTRESMLRLPFRPTGFVAVWFQRSAMPTVALAEITLAALLLSGIAGFWIGLTTALLFVIFTGYLILMSLRLNAVTCGCFGNNHTTTLRHTAARNLVLVAWAIGLALISSGGFPTG